MTAFRFRLEKVLAWRRTQAQLADSEYRREAAAVAALDQASAELEARAIQTEAEVRDWSPLEGSDLAALGAFRGSVERQTKDLAARRIEQTKKLAEREQDMLEARRRCRLLERLRERFGVNVKSQPPTIGYQETIRKSIAQRGRHKKQSGGHGQFGDVVLEVRPMVRGGGFEFHEKVVGGAVPRNYIGAVEEGVVDGLLRGPLGFPVIDVQVTLTDGSYHSVDSSDLAFRTAARIGVSEALPQCQPVLLEPIHVVEIVCPTEATAKINAILSGRRGQILGFDTREGWPGWDRVRAMMPEAEIGELIVELRSATAGAGSFTRQFDRMAEVTGRAADQIIAAHRVAA